MKSFSSMQIELNEAKFKLPRGEKELKRDATKVGSSKVQKTNVRIVAATNVNMFEAIQKWTSEDKPYLGICVGYQLIFEKSVESPSTEGLAILPGTVKRFPDVDLKIPHMGWNSISPSHPDDGLWKDMPANPFFYFVHSYYPEPSDTEHIAASCDYAVSFAAAVRRGNLVATQFHPEKSQHNGLQLLRNFLAVTS